MLCDSFKVAWSSKYIETTLSNFIKSGTTQSIVLSPSFNDGTEKTLAARLCIPQRSPIPTAGIRRFSDLTHSPSQVSRVLAKRHQWKHFSSISLWIGSRVVCTQPICTYLQRYRYRCDLGCGRLFDLWVQKKGSMASFPLVRVIILTRHSLKTLYKYQMPVNTRFFHSNRVSAMDLLLHIKFWKNSWDYLMSSHGNIQNIRNIASYSVALKSDSIKMHKNVKHICIQLSSLILSLCFQMLWWVGCLY